MQFKKTIREFRHNLGLVFDDDLGTGTWYNVVDWVIVFMILLSAVEIFMSTLPVSAQMQRVLTVINDVTLWFFVVEVTLRIWAAPEQNPNYKGFRGRVRYCCTFYGFIDFISTYPFLLQFFLPMSVGALHIMRVARIIRVFRITRYASSFNLLSDAIKEKKNELIVSLQFLVIVTFILSIMLYIYEHNAQPEVYDNGIRSVVWSFAQYIGDPGQFADTPPITVPGRIVACLVGLMGIAIVAVPAGILGAGFTEAIENRNKKETIATNSERLRSAFQRKLDRPTGYQIVQPFLTVNTLQAKLSMTMNEIVEAVNSECAPHFRLVNTSSSIPVGTLTSEEIAVEHYIVNRPYGCLIDRGSNITIVSPSSYIDMGVGNWSFYLAAIGGFNYISREVGDRAATKSYFLHDDRGSVEGLDEFISDLQSLLSRPDAWSFTILAASGALEPEYPTHIHFQTGGKKGDTAIGKDSPLVKDTKTYEALYKVLSERLRSEFDILTDHQKYHDSSSGRNYLNKGYFANENNVIMRIEWKRILWDFRRIKLAKTIAEEIWNALENREMPESVTVLKTKQIGFDGYI